MDAGSLVYKVATEPWEFDQIHRLNYETFVEEIPQYKDKANPDRRLVDKFHDRNTYVICLEEDRLIGMISYSHQRPFSLDYKVADLDTFLPPHRKVCELRLLSVVPDRRHSRVFHGLIAKLALHCLDQGFDLALISGTTRQLKLYRHLGFVPFGPLTGTAEAAFQPMYLTLEGFTAVYRTLAEEPGSRARVNLQTGPVAPVADVRQAMGAQPVSHRDERFLADLRLARRLLCRLVKAPHAAIMLGSGTMANDVVAAQLSLLPGNGLVLSNGEFGERLVDQAARFGLRFEAMTREWGVSLDLPGLRDRLARDRTIGWVWAVHSETSTGMLNDLDALRTSCAGTGAKLCLDCISSVGSVPVNLNGVWLATATSGKGLASYPGLGVVFHEQPVLASNRLPRYLDLGLYAGSEGVPFTHSSNLVGALLAALKRYRTDQAFAVVASAGAALRKALESAGLRAFVEGPQSHPAVVTIALPTWARSCEVGDRLREQGYLIGYRSRYLVDRNWVQLSLFGAVESAEIRGAIALIADACSRRPA